MISKAFFKELEKEKIPYLINEPMREHTAFKIGGNADALIRVSSCRQVRRVLLAAAETETPLFVLGNGSNLLVSDAGISGAVLCLDDMKEITVSQNEIVCAAGARLSAVCVAARDAGLTGLEFAYGIPASVGGALYMNAGAYGGEMADVVLSAECMDKSGRLLTLTAQDMRLGYRTSVFKGGEYIILSVRLSLKYGEKEAIASAMEDFLSRRREKQPLEYPSAGSTFKRPAGHYAGALIEKNGFKGYSHGGAAVSEKHAGFIINRGNATAADVEALIAEIQSTVSKNDGVWLEPEVIRVGRKEKSEL